MIDTLRRVGLSLNPDSSEDAEISFSLRYASDSDSNSGDDWIERARVASLQFGTDG